MENPPLNVKVLSNLTYVCIGQLVIDSPFEEKIVPQRIINLIDAAKPVNSNAAHPI